ncbi:kinase-like protein [Heliocybe sulcata]|uniref:Kinase-like protein n=1 Tax=Heliocybe sulcata TaxID=5364 RepID=A0A5C3MTG6_9AGAM|nr:kinase-like protein [Heliocybe sulcata]
MTTSVPYRPYRTASCKARKLLVKLGENHAVVPSQCYITNVCLTNSSYPITGGGFADIFQGYLGKTLVAVKRLRVFASSMTAEQEHQLKRLCREALVWQQIHHPNILPFLGVARDLFPFQLCLVAPWAAKGNIVTYLENHPAPTVRLIYRLLYQVARGVAYLHWLNIVHGDLRGANILIDEDHHVRLADFGLSVFAEGTAGPGTCTNRDGSMAWMAPELIDPVQFGHHDYYRTTATDVYAYACVCLEVCTGRRPFAGLPDSAILLSVLRGERPPRPSNTECRGLALHDNLWDIMTRCWNPNALSRPDVRQVACCLGEMQRNAI